MVHEVYHRMKNSGNYAWVRLHEEYNIGNRIGGEADILAQHNLGYHVYGEVKTTRFGEPKAMKQFNRWKENHPEDNTKFMLIVANPGRVWRKYVE